MNPVKHLLIGLLLLGGALFSAKADRYPDSAKSTRNVTTVRVLWLKDFVEVDIACTFLNNESPGQGVKGCYSESRNLIIAVEPTSFNDHYRLMILGHEFWHALGAEHPKLP